MNLFDELEAQYNEIDRQYSSKEFEASRRGWNRKEEKYHRKRELNDQAYFLFMFSRLEDHIRLESSTLISKKQSSISSWKQRSSWDILPNSARGEMPFKNRLALLAQKGFQDYNLIIGYYKERNSIAHGGNFTSAINMPTVISEFKRLYKKIRA